MFFAVNKIFYLDSRDMEEVIYNSQQDNALLGPCTFLCAFTITASVVVLPCQ
jgi:hypothetical protein